MGMSFDGNGMGAVCMHLQLLQFAVFMHLLPRVDAMCLHLVGRRTLIALVNDMQFLFRNFTRVLRVHGIYFSIARASKVMRSNTFHLGCCARTCVPTHNSPKFGS